MIKLKNICLIKRCLSTKYTKTIVKWLFFIDEWFFEMNSIRQKNIKISIEIVGLRKNGVTFIAAKTFILQKVFFI
jgi:hypothetical protein